MIVSEFAELMEEITGNPVEKGMTLCPVHTEKNASCTVNETEAWWNCHACHTGGDAVSLIMHTHGALFLDAVEMLREYRPSDVEAAFPNLTRTDEQRAIDKAADQLVDWLTGNLDRVEDWLRDERGINRQTAVDMKMGFWGSDCPVEKDKLVDLGLMSDSSDRPLLANRLIIPVYGTSQRILFFIGRAVEEDQEPKYLYSKDSHKSNHIFGATRKRTSKAGIVVEGVMDVAQGKQHGTPNVVSILGSHVSMDQATILSRHFESLVFVLDSDQAGQLGIERLAFSVASLSARQTAFEISERGKIKGGLLMQNLFVCHLPEGMDPDDMIKDDPDGWDNMISNPQPLIMWCLDQLATDLTNSAGVVKFVQVMAIIISSFGDPLYQSIIISRMKQRIDLANPSLELVSKDDIKEAVKTSTPIDVMAISPESQIMFADLFYANHDLLSSAIREVESKIRKSALCADGLFVSDEKVDVDESVIKMVIEEEYRVRAETNTDDDALPILLRLLRN